MGKPKLTFFAKSESKCPVCGAKFHREDLLTGGGRMIAGKLTNELRRLYEPSKKYGEIFPIVYSLTVCPECLYSAYSGDFFEVDESTKNILYKTIQERKDGIRKLFGDLDYSQPRQLKEGVASYHLALMCYEHVSSGGAPTFKMALSCLRAAWLSDDLHKKYPGENYDYLREIYYHKANFLYSRVIELETTGEESLEVVNNYGPYPDKNFGYDGVLYLVGLLEYKYGGQGDSQRRSQSLRYARQAISRIVGLGKSSKSKPSDILEMARDLHKQIGDLLKEIEDEA